MTTDALRDAMAEFQRCVEARDQGRAELVLAQDFELLLVSPASARVTRAEWLAMLPDYVVHAHVVEEQAIDVDGDCAAVLQRVHQEATVLGGDRSGTFVITDLWRRRAGGWALWRRHSTPATAGAMPTLPSE